MVEKANDPILQKDLEYIANSQIELDKLSNSTILVTGATGLVGNQVIMALLACNRLKNSKINIIGLARNKDKTANMYG